MHIWISERSENMKIVTESMKSFDMAKTFNEHLAKVRFKTGTVVLF